MKLAEEKSSKIQEEAIVVSIVENHSIKVKTGSHERCITLIVGAGNDSCRGGVVGRGGILLEGAESKKTSVVSVVVTSDVSCAASTRTSSSALSFSVSSIVLHLHNSGDFEQ